MEGEDEEVTEELWVMGRRPDLYSVGLMSHLLHRLGQHVLRDLNGSPDDQLTRGLSEHPGGDGGALRQPVDVGVDEARRL